MSQTVPRDPYEVLGVARDADDTQIKKAFRRLARELHPDTNPDDPEAQERFREVAEANEILTDPERRATYDRYGHDGLKQRGMGPQYEGFGNISDLFGAVFGQAFGGGGGGSRPGRRPGEDLGVEVALTLDESMTGTKVDVELERIATCGTCEGNRAKPGTGTSTCTRCGGHGVLERVSRTPFGDMAQRVACDACDGRGSVPDEPCPACRGRGVRPVTSSLSVDVPPGIADGQRIRLGGRGHDGDKGAPAGDLYVLVRVKPHDRFVREDDDLVTVVPVSLPAAALGQKLDIDLFGEELEVDLPAGTQPGTTITLRGRGMPHVGGGRRGDLHVVVDVAVPRKLDDRQRDLLREFDDSLEPKQMADGEESIVGRLRRLWRKG